MAEAKQKYSVVTGSGGFIGRHLVRALAPLGPVIALDLPGCDVTRRSDISRALDHTGSPAGALDCVFHLAGQKSVGKSAANPVETLETSLLGTLNVLEAARGAGARRVVLVSSVAVYRGPAPAGFREDSPVRDDTVYAASKFCGERIGLAYHGEYGLPVVIARLGNVFGPGQSREAVVANLMAQMAAGGDVELGNLKDRRDFLYVSDAVDALVALATHPAAAGRAWNVGSGSSRSVEDVFRAAAVEFGYRREPVSRTGGTNSSGSEIFLDNSAIRNQIGWGPSVSFEQGVRLTAAAVMADAGRTK